jgi:tetratricopeptide (TPR) repeat protein
MTRMIIGLCLLVILSPLKSALAAEVVSKPEPRTILVVPFATYANAPDWVSISLAQALMGLIAEANRDSFLTLKQLDVVLRRRDLRIQDVSDLELGLPVARALGATNMVVGEIRNLEGRYFVKARLVSVDSRSIVRKMQAEVSKKELPSLVSRLGQTLLDISDKVPLTTSSASAMELGALCTVDIIHTPLGPRAPKVLSIPRAEEAEAACLKALKIDPDFGLARAGHALFLSMKDELTKARSEASTARQKSFIPLAWLVESYLARRAGDQKAARGILKSAAQKRHGFLHPLGYLAEDLSDAGDFAAALKVFEEYLRRSPRHPWALAQKGRLIARLGKFDKAITLTKRALELDPGNPELLIELASRYIDADRDSQAEQVLKKVLKVYPIRPKALLRVGYIHLRRKQTKPAFDFLNRALVEAWREDEWRVRGLAQADLARVAGLEGDYPGAIEHLAAALAEGGSEMLPCDAPELKDFKGKPEFEGLCGGGN